MISLNQETETQIRLARINADTYEDLGVRMLGANVATEGLVSGIESMQAALDTTETQMSMLNEVMSGAVGKEQKDYAEAQEKNREKAASLRAELEKLEKVYGSNSERVVEIRGQLHELNVAQEENTAAHEEATKRILFDIAARQLAMDGLTSREVEALRLLSLEWGLQDKATADAVANVLNATLQLAEDDSIDNFINSVDDAREGTAKLGASIRDLPTSKEITITTNYITIGDRPTGISEERGRQFGGPVFRGQPYLVGESGPEAFVPSRSGYILNREDAMAALRGANVRGGDTYNITINDLTILDEEERQLLKKIVALKTLLHSITQNYQVHLLSYYAIELANQFHSFYAAHRVIEITNIPQSRKRLALVQILQNTFALSFELLGISCPEKM